MATNPSEPDDGYVGYLKSLTIWEKVKRVSFILLLVAAIGAIVYSSMTGQIGNRWFP